MPLIVALALSLVAPVQTAAPTPPVFLEPGETVPPFDAPTLDGGMRHVDYPAGKATVLLFFLSSCSVCHRMLPVWNDAYGRLLDDVQVVGVIMDREPPGFFELMPVAFPVVRAPDARFRATFKVSRVPLTVRIAPGGRVQEVGQGIIDPIRLGEMLRSP